MRKQRQFKGPAVTQMASVVPAKKITVNDLKLVKKVRQGARVQLPIRDGCVFVLSDQHYYSGLVSVAHKASLKLANESKPWAIISNGDAVDAACISRFQPSSFVDMNERVPLKDEISETVIRLGEYTAIPQVAFRVWNMGNHDARFETKLAEKVPEYAGVEGTTLKDHFPGNGIQSFNRQHAMNNAILLFLAIVALVIPSLFSYSIETTSEGVLKVEILSLGVAGIMIVLYALGLLFGYRTGHEPAAQPAGAADHAAIRRHWSLRTALILLAIATVGVAYLSELLVGAVEPIVASYGISEFFLGIILIPLIGNVAEHLVAVQVAVQNKMDLSVEISLASSLQIALFVARIRV